MNEIFDKIWSVIGDISLSNIVGSLMLLIILIVISKCLARIIKRLLKKTKLSESFIGFITTIVKFILYFASILIVCDSLGLPVTSLLAVFSLFGLAISLSVQSLLGNLMSGLSLHTLKPFEVGDYIETDIAGTVKNIGLFYTELTTPDNKKVFIPNEKIMADKLVNYTGETTRRIDIVVNAGYSYDTESVKEVLRKAIASVEGVLDVPEPTVGISEYAESGINYSIWVWTDVSNYIKTKFALMDAIGKAYKENGIKMAYNHVEVELVNKEQSSIK